MQTAPVTEQTPEALRTQGGPAHRQRSNRGLALLMTILVLSSLLILGISLSTAVKADFEEAVFYRSYNEAHIRAQEGMSQAMGFLMYDVWGVNERDPFVCSQWKGSASGDTTTNKALGDTLIADAGGVAYSFSYNAAPLIASELELRRIVYPNVPFQRFAAAESTSLVSDWDWANMNIGGGTRVNQHELYGSPLAGRSRYTDPFLPTSSDVNDWFEIGMHINRSDLHGYWRNNFPNRPTDIYAGGSAGGWGHNRNGATVGEYKWHVGWGDYHGLEGYNFPFAEGLALTDPIVTAPWNFVNTNAMMGDSFTRVFRSDLVDPNYENNTYDAMVMGPKIASADGKQYGGAININEVNNNYETENFPGVTTPNDVTRFPVGSADYQANNNVDDPGGGSGVGEAERFYYAGRSFHYNEAKWIYCYNDLGKPTGRYAVTISPDGGLPNVNSLGHPRYSHYFGWFPLSSEYPGIFPAYDRGSTIMGNMLYGRKSYGTAASTAPGGGFAANDVTNAGGADWRAWSDETGANRIKNGSILNITKPGMADTYGVAANYHDTYGTLTGTWPSGKGGASPVYYPRAYASTNRINYDNSVTTTAFAGSTGNTNHPKMIAWAGAGQFYAGPNGDAGYLKVMGQGIISHVFWHLLANGPVRTRSEFMMLLKKRAFMIDDENYNGMAANGLDENKRGNGTFYDEEDMAIAEQDCQYLAGWITPIGYHYTLDSLWTRDRVILDSTGDLYMGGSANQKSNAFFWSGIGSNTRKAGADPSSGYEGDCPTEALDDSQATPGPSMAMAGGDYLHSYKMMHRKIKGKTGAMALLQELAQLRYMGSGLGVKHGGLTPYSPLSERTDSAGIPIPGWTAGPASVRRANAAGALSLAYLLCTIRTPNFDYLDQWRTEMRFGDSSGVVVKWQQPAGGGWEPDITIWNNMHWRQAWEVADISDWDYRNSVRNNVAPTYGAFALHQYQRSTVTEIGRARVYQPYYQNDQGGGAASNDGRMTGNSDASTRDFRYPLQQNQQTRLYLPKYENVPYNQWMTHQPGYAFDLSGIGLRETWSNYMFTICGTPTSQLMADGTSVNTTGITLSKFAPGPAENGTDFRAIIRTTTPLPVKPNDEVVIAGAPAPFNGNRHVVSVLAPNAFEIFLSAAEVGATAVGNYGGGTVNLRMTDDPNLGASAGPDFQDHAYPVGIPLVMNYIELCFGQARANGSTDLDNIEVGESLTNKAFRKNHVPSDYFRMWVTDYNVAGTAGWTNLYDGNPPRMNDIKNLTWRGGDTYGLTGSKNNQSYKWNARFSAGSGNSQPFLYVKGRLMQGDAAGAGGPLTTNTWYTDTDGKPGLRLLINMFDQFDPIHWGVSVRECDAGGALQWVNYNIDEQHQRGVQRVFGRITDITWGIGNDRIANPGAAPSGDPTANNNAGGASFDNSFRWTTRAGNRGMFIRAHTPMVNQRGITNTQVGVRPFPLENFLIDMPVTLAMRQLAEKRGSANQGGPDAQTGGMYNLGTYLTSYSWANFNRTYAQDCDWAAHHWWAMDGNTGVPAFNGGPNINYDGTAPILRWDSAFDRSTDGHHEAYVKSGSDTGSYGLFSPTAGNSPLQSMTQGHPEQFKVIYFHPYFFPQKIVYGTRNRTSLNSNNSRYYDYVYPLITTSWGTFNNSPNVITNITRSAMDPATNKSLVTVTYSGDIGLFIHSPGSAGNGSPMGDQYARISGCSDATFNGIYKITPGAGTFTYYQDGNLGAAAVVGNGFDNTPNNNQPAGYCTRHWAFARDFGGGHYMSGGAVGGPWASTYGAGVLPASAANWTRGSGMANNAWNIGSYYPVDYNTMEVGRNANAQSPVDLLERVHGIITLPDYLGIDLGAPEQPNQTKPASKLWTEGPWWVDGDEGQGPIEMDDTFGPTLAIGDFVVGASGARARVVTKTGGKAGNKVVLEPCAPYTGGFKNGDAVSEVTFNAAAAAFEFVGAPLGNVANATGQRLWIDYGRYCNATRVDSGGVSMPNFAAMSAQTDYTQAVLTATPLVPPITFNTPPTSSLNSYLRGVLEFSVSAPWVLDNQGSGMWQYNSAWGYKAPSKGAAGTEGAIYGGGASNRFDPAFGNVRWYLARGTDHQAQVFSLPTPMERNTNHIAWGASPYQRDRWGNGIEPDPARPGGGPLNPGFNRHNGCAPGSPTNQYVENKLELALHQIGNATFAFQKNMYYLTPIGASCADELDLHTMNWWDLNFCTDLDNMWELGVINNDGVSFLHLGKDPLSVSSDPANYSNKDPAGWFLADVAKGYDISQMYTNNNSYNDFIDNQNRGVREILTRTPLNAVDVAQGVVEGHYNDDRQTTFKINPNLIPAPMLYQWLQGNWTVGQDQPTYVFGCKPARGYISASHMIGYCGTSYSDYHMTNWNSRVWYKHQSIAPSSFNDYFGVTYVTEGYGRMSNMVNFSPAPVYTAMITGQSINDAGEAVAQIRLTVGVERTYDGKCNILEYQINTGLLGVR